MARPIDFTIDKNGITYFHYSDWDWANWYYNGIDHGNTGGLLVRRDGYMLTYHIFGTIENPNKRMQTMQMTHLELFDGPMPSDEDRIKPELPRNDLNGLTFKIIDPSENKT